ncbi:agmatinase [Owenweeksia hongkongensis]|uniref:agmatinase n=1 Tax=Owenweeksia hongkongensis TaxID=253245 RepID=UPI003A8EF752
MTKQEKISAFDPNGLATSDQLFGLPFSYEESETVVIPIPWEVTVSYSAGTASGPRAIAEASLQVDLYDAFLKDAWKRGIFMLEQDHKLEATSNQYRHLAEKHIDNLESEKVDEKLLHSVNGACTEMVARVKELCANALSDGKRVALLGGDHSTPLGYMQALAERYDDFAILQIDAHADLRDAYEGFEYSHASIMFNALKIPQVSKLVQVGIRDYCEAENDIIEQSNGRVTTYFDRDLKAARYNGKTWKEQCGEIVAQLPEKVYLSFDIDGLDPKLCPNTGTPVAGGFEVEEVLYLLETLVKSGKKIIGLDLNEVAPGEDEWDANVGARLLYRLCNIMAVGS